MKNLHVHVHIHQEDGQLRADLNRMEARMSQQIDQLAAAVAEQTTVSQGLESIITATVERLDELAAELEAANGDAEVVANVTAKIREHTASLSNGSAALQAAIVENTVAQPGTGEGDADIEDIPASDDLSTP